jgi:predicted nuclease with TOPRIM domain
MNIDFVTVFTLVASISAVIIAWRRAPAEVRQINNSAANSISEAAKILVEPLTKRVDDLEVELADACDKYDTLKGKYETLEEQYRELRRENEIMDEWARRLVHQVQSMGGAPVPKRISG